MTKADAPPPRRKRNAPAALQVGGWWTAFRTRPPRPTRRPWRTRGCHADRPCGRWRRCRPARRQGHGRALLDHAKARADRLSLWTFEANREALAFYAAQGFAETARTDGDNEEGLPDVRLEWRRP